MLNDNFAKKYPNMPAEIGKILIFPQIQFSPFSFIQYIMCMLQKFTFILNTIFTPKLIV